MLSYLIIIFSINMQRQKKSILMKKIIILFFNNILFIPINCFSSTNCKDVFQFLYQTVGLKNALKNNIFNLYGSGGINYRSIVTTPIGLYYNNTDAFFNNFSVNIFYLGMPNGVLFGDSNKASALIKGNNLVEIYTEKIINFLQNSPYIAINFPFLGEAFDYINIIQNRLGFILQGCYELNNNTALYIQLPFIYCIYYPSIPSELQGVISMEIAQFGFSPNELENNPSVNFNKSTSRDVMISHSVYDTFGLDRSVAGIYSKWFDEMINTELRILFPGADLMQNKIGGDFKQAQNQISSLGLKKLLINIINNASEDQIDWEELTSKLLIGFDRVILGSYYTPLANQSTGISPSLIYHIPLGHEIFIDGYLSYIYNFSQQRIGCAMQNNNELNPNIDFEVLSLGQACRDLDIFTKILEQKFIPDVCQGTFSPGGEYQASLAIRSSISDMSLVLGVDLWHQAQSEFLPTISNIFLINFPMSATQCNGFLNFEYYTCLWNMPLTVQCSCQGTFYAQGIGEEYGIKLQLTMQY